jgi:hypothetical protein
MRLQYVQNNRIAGFVREYIYDYTPDFGGYNQINLAPHRSNAATPWPVSIMPAIPMPVIAAQAGPVRGLRNHYRDYVTLATYGEDSQAQVDAWAAQASQGPGPATTERHQDGLFDGTQTRFEGDRPWMWLPDGPNGPGIY